VNNSAGTHSIQALLDTIETKEENEMLFFLIHKYLLKLIINSNGMHVVQKILIKINEQCETEYINEFLIENIVRLSMNANGLCVVKKFLSANKQQKTQTRVIKNITLNCTELIQDPFGNYLIQFVFELYGQNNCIEIIKQIVSNVILFSCQKFSSNVVERVIEASSSEKQIYFALINEMFFTKNNFTTLLKNKYGTFVLAKAIKQMNSNEKLYVRNCLMNNVTCTGNKEKGKFKYVIDLMCF